VFIGRLFCLVNDDEILEELKKIRALLEKPPAPPPPKGLWNEFKDFLAKYKVFGLAIAFVIGLYLGTLVQALVKDLLLPAIGLAIPGMSNLATYTTGPFAVGDFLVALITFVIVAFIVFLAVKVVKRWGIEA
jgi:large conductance mechanosensitive channel